MTLPIFSLFFRKDEPIGKKGERVAAEYLKKKGFKILEMNYKNPKGKQLGEIDIIAKKDATIIFVEVKTRKGIVENTFPEDNLTPWKLQKLEKIATHYLQTHHPTEISYHFDAVTVIFNENKIASIRHFEHIFI